MQRKEVRGVVVYANMQNESSKRVGLYTEEGMMYFTIYGARSSKGHSKSTLSLFTMGRFVFNIGARDIAKFVDVQIYDNGYGLINDIESYYAACASAEIVRSMADAEHNVQFKIIIDYLLYIGTFPKQWRIGIIVFLWRSLSCNGWQPEISDELMRLSEGMKSDIHNVYTVYLHTEGFIEASQREIESKTNAIQYSMIDMLVQKNDAPYRELCMYYESFSQEMCDIFIKLLFEIWQHIIGHKLILSEFVIH